MLVSFENDFAQSKDQRMQNFVKPLLVPALVSTRNAISGVLCDPCDNGKTGEQLQLCGIAAVRVALLRAHLLLPASSLDPATKPLLKCHLQREQNQQVGAELITRRWLESIRCGGMDTPQTSHLQHHRRL